MKKNEAISEIEDVKREVMLTTHYTFSNFEKESERTYTIYVDGCGELSGLRDHDIRELHDILNILNDND